MGISTEEKSLSDALRSAKINYLPGECIGENSIWLKAIVHVTKVNNSKNYCIAVNNGDDSPVVVQDFGKSARIFKIDSIHPYLLMNKDSIPVLNANREIINYLTGFGYDYEYIRSLVSFQKKDGEKKTANEKADDKKTIDKLIRKVAIQYEIRRLEEIKKFD